MSRSEEPHAYDGPERRRTTRQTRTIRDSGDTPPHHTATAPSAPPPSAHPTMTYPPQTTDSDHPQPEVWCTVLERGHYYIVSAAAASPGPQGVIRGTDTMLITGTARPRAIGDPTNPAQGPQGRPPAEVPSHSPRPGPNHLRGGGLPPETSHALPIPVDQAPLAVHRGHALDLGHPHHPHTSRGGPRHTEGAPSPATTPPHLRVPRRTPGPPPHGP